MTFDLWRRIILLILSTFLFSKSWKHLVWRRFDGNMFGRAGQSLWSCCPGQPVYVAGPGSLVAGVSVTTLTRAPSVSQPSSGRGWASALTSDITRCKPCHPEQGQILSLAPMCRPQVTSRGNLQLQLQLLQFIVHLLQREAEHEAAPPLTAPGDYNRYRVCNFFALVCKVQFVATCGLCEPEPYMCYRLQTRSHSLQ